MKRLLTLLLCGVLVLGLTACGGQPDTQPSTTATTTTTEEDYEKIYVDDPTVNLFITHLYERGDLQLLGTSRGSRPDEYILYTNDCEVTVHPNEHGLYLDIRGGRTETSLKRVFSLFRYFCAVADSTCTEKQMDDAIAWMQQPTRDTADYRVSNYVRILRYRPLSTEPTVSIDCHVELLLTNYLPPKETE